MKSGPGSFRVLLLGAILAGAALIGGTMGSYWYAQRAQRLMAYTGTPYLTNVEGAITTQFRAGDAMILNLQVRRQPGECFADYSTVLTGPVVYQAPMRRSQFFSETVTDLTVRIFVQIPEKLPPGQYDLHQIVSPTCYGVPLKPFVPQMNLRILIEN